MTRAWGNTESRTHAALATPKPPELEVPTTPDPNIPATNGFLIEPGRGEAEIPPPPPPPDPYKLLRVQAAHAINHGASPELVRARFRSIAGIEL